MEELVKRIKKEVEQYSDTVTVEIIKNTTSGREVVRITDKRGIFLPHTVIKNCHVSCYACGEEVIMLVYKC